MEGFKIVEIWSNCSTRLASPEPYLPVTFHLIAQLLDVAKPTAGVALLLIGVIAVTGHVTSFPASVAELLSLLFGLLAVPGNVTTPVAVVAR